MEYGLQLNVGDKFLVNVDEPVNRGKWKHNYNGHWLRVTSFGRKTCHATWEYQNNPGKQEPKVHGWECEEWYWHPEHIAAYWKGPKHMEQFKPAARTGLPDI